MVRVSRLRKRKVIRNRGVIHIPSEEDWEGLFREMEAEKPRLELPSSRSVDVPEADATQRFALPLVAAQHRASQHDTTAFKALIDEIRESIDG